MTHCYLLGQMLIKYMLPPRIEDLNAYIVLQERSLSGKKEDSAVRNRTK